jgi:hypothetical protein
MSCPVKSLPADAQPGPVTAHRTSVTLSVMATSCPSPGLGHGGDSGALQNSDMRIKPVICPVLPVVSVGDIIAGAVHEGSDSGAT